MLYLCLAFTCVWLTMAGYVLILDRHVKDLSKRLHARDSTDEGQ